MSNESQFDTTAANNNSASPNGAPEGMAPSGVNDTIRENMAAAARVYQDQNGTLVTTGTGTAYVLSTNNSHAALADIGLTAFRVHTASTGSATLAVDGLTAKTMRINGQNVKSGELVQDTVVFCVYNADQDAFDLILPNVPGYRVGSWTPSVGGTATYTTQNGIYVQIGRQVFIKGNLTINSIGTGSTTVISGLPITSRNTATGHAGGVTVNEFASIASSVVLISGKIGDSSSDITFVSATGAATSTSSNAIFGNSANVKFEGSYEV